MPRVWLEYDARIFPERLASILQAELREVLAVELSCRDFDGVLTAEDIEVKTEPFGPHDFNGRYGITITILANDFPDRRANLDVRREKVGTRLRSVLDALGVRPDIVRGCVYIAIVPASFGEF